MANPYAEKIERILTPVVGGFVAKITVRSQCKSLGITPDEIGIQHLDKLSGKIGAALAFHGHKQEADKITGIIKHMY
jgi:hypothetical protein